MKRIWPRRNCAYPSAGCLFCCTTTAFYRLPWSGAGKLFKLKIQWLVEKCFLRVRKEVASDDILSPNLCLVSPSQCLFSSLSSRRLEIFVFIFSENRRHRFGFEQNLGGPLHLGT